MRRVRVLLIEPFGFSAAIVIQAFSLTTSRKCFQTVAACHLKNHTVNDLIDAHSQITACYLINAPPTNKRSPLSNRRVVSIKITPKY